MRSSTKAQIQIGEMVAVIFVVMILLMFGLYWFFQQGVGETQNLREQEFQLSLLEKTKEVMNMPEIQHSFAATPDNTMVDEFRARAFRNKLDDDEAFRAAYQDRYYGYALTIQVLYPRTQTFHVFDFEPPTTTGSQQAAVPITVYDPITERASFAMLILTQYDTTQIQGASS